MNNIQGLGEKMHYSNEVRQRCPQRQASRTSKYQFSHIDKKQYHAHGHRRELAVNLHANDAEAGTSVNGNPRQDKVTMGRVLSPGSNDD